MTQVECALTELLVGQRGPTSTAVMRWLILGEHLHDRTPVDIAWLPTDAPHLFI